MKFITFQTSGDAPQTGLLVAETNEILDLRRGLADFAPQSNLPAPADVLMWLDLDQPFWKEASLLHQKAVSDSKFAGSLRERNLLFPRDQAQLLAPILRPGKIICVGLNYRDHAIESNLAIPERPLLFSKFSTAVIAPNETVVIPAGSEKVDYEAELAVVIGRRAKAVSKKNVFDYVFGYTNFNDVSARDWQFADGQWQRGKSCDTFAPLGEFIATKDEIPDPHNLSIRLSLNGRVMQDSNTTQLIFGIPELIEFIAASVTLEPGDVIATGTPSGVGFARQPPIFLTDGDVVEVAIEKLGVLRNPVAKFQI